MVDIEALAREAGLPQRIDRKPGMVSLWDVELRRFAALVAEECARACDAEQRQAAICVGRLAGASTAMETARVLAGTIRAAFPMPKEST